MWAPPKKCKLSIWLSPRDRSASPDWSKFLPLGFKDSFRGIYIELALGSPKLPAILDAVKQLPVQPEVELKWHIEEPPRPVPESGGWFDPLMGGSEADNALKLRKGVHYGFVNLGAECNHTPAFVASDEFLQVVRDHGLRGLASLPLPPVGNRPQVGWSHVWAEQPMGRGLDHPASRSDVISARYAVDRDWDPARRFGLSHVHDDDIDAARIEHPLIQRLADLGKGSIRGPDHFVAEGIPNVDFAYDGWGTSNDRTFKHRWRGILFSRKARDAVVAAGLMKESQFDPVGLVPMSQAQTLVLDKAVKGPLPPPVYTPAEAATERVRREEMLKKLTAPPTRRKPQTLKQCSAALKAAAKDAGVPTLANDSALMRAIEQSKLFAKLPASWRELLPAVPVRLIDLEQPEAELWIACEPEPASFTADSDVRARPVAERPSSKDIVIGTTAFGDWYAIRTDNSALPRDAVVRLWSHETLYPTQAWDTVAEFAAYLAESASNK